MGAHLLLNLFTSNVVNIAIDMNCEAFITVRALFEKSSGEYAPKNMDGAFMKFAQYSVMSFGLPLSQVS